MLRRLLLILALISPLPVTAQDDAAADEGEGEVCLLYANLWRGTNADIRDIERTPVPESFRGQFESTAWCNHLQPESLIDWHLPFGTEASATAALVYLERAYMRDVPAPERFENELTSAWHAARDDLRRAGEIELDHLDQSARWIFIGQSRTIQRFRRIAYDPYSSYAFLARQHLRVAEEHGSPALLEKARHYIGAARIAAELVASLEEAEPVRGLLTFDLGTFGIDDLEMRAAVLQAELTRSPQAIADAEAIVQAKERPDYRRFGRDAFFGGEGFCDLGSATRQELATACEDDDDFLHERVVSYLTARAMLNLATDDQDPSRRDRDTAIALRLLEAERYHQSGRALGMPTANELLVRLHLALARNHRRQYAEIEVDSAIAEALDELRQAERLTPPFDAPRRFQRIAREWLELYRIWQGVQAESGDTPAPHDERYAAYLTQTLAGLRVMSQGAD